MVRSRMAGTLCDVQDADDPAVPRPQTGAAGSAALADLGHRPGRGTPSDGGEPRSGRAGRARRRGAEGPHPVQQPSREGENSALASIVEPAMLANRR